MPPQDFRTCSHPSEYSRRLTSDWMKSIDYSVLKTYLPSNLHRFFLTRKVCHTTCNIHLSRAKDAFCRGAQSVSRSPFIPLCHPPSPCPSSHSPSPPFPKLPLLLVTPIRCTYPRSPYQSPSSYCSPFLPVPVLSTTSSVPWFPVLRPGSPR